MPGTTAGLSVILRPVPGRLYHPRRPTDGQPAAGLGETENAGWHWKHFSHSLIKRGVIGPLMPSEEQIRAVCNSTAISRSLSPKRRRGRVGARQICFLGHNSFTFKVHLGELEVHLTLEMHLTTAGRTSVTARRLSVKVYTPFLQFHSCSNRLNPSSRKRAGRWGHLHTQNTSSSQKCSMKGEKEFKM